MRVEISVAPQTDSLLFTEDGKCVSNDVRDPFPPHTEPHLLMEQVIAYSNVDRAVRRVVANNGAPGMDGVVVGPTGRPGEVDLETYLEINRARHETELLLGRYTPYPVSRVLIPKYGSNKYRKLGIPTAIDRVIQQSILQVLQPVFDPHFSDYSFGYRPRPANLPTHTPQNPAHRALSHWREIVCDGYTWVVSIDLQSFFDTVDHKILMDRVARRVEDERILRTIWSFLRAPVHYEGRLHRNRTGMPQGGPLSPLLSNILLDDLDKELEDRGLHFCRFADDFIILLRTPAAARRVRESVGEFLARELKLKVNEEKSKVVRWDEAEYLGYGLTSEKHPRYRVSTKSLCKLKEGIRSLPGVVGKRNRRREEGDRVSYHRALSELLRGWLQYFRLGTPYGLFRDLKDKELPGLLLTRLDEIEAMITSGECVEYPGTGSLSPEEYPDYIPHPSYTNGNQTGLLKPQDIDILRSQLLLTGTPLPPRGAGRRGTR